jgi:sulfate adenylyltransferase subunit 1
VKRRWRTEKKAGTFNRDLDFRQILIMELLRFFTAGNVDDGKSTLIGRLLYDSQSISTDVIETLTRQSKITGVDTQIDLALLTDGLRSEREQGITIDVAYKYFSTDKRKFIIADTPGHEQYTRNMFTGASNTDVAIILIDARVGITDQTRRHSIISSILNIPQVLICINKMDLVDYDQKRFEKIRAEYLAFSNRLEFKNINFIPVSALAGDNVVKPSISMDWYKGETLFEFLENVHIETVKDVQSSFFQIQYVIRPQTEIHRDYRGYAGTLLSGTLKKGDKVKLFPLELETVIESLEKNQVEVDEIHEGEPGVIHLKDNVDLGRGSIIVGSEVNSKFEQSIAATICWMDNKPFQYGQNLLLQNNSFVSKAAIKAIDADINVETLEETPNSGSIPLNGIAKVTIKLADPLCYEVYKQNRKTGAFILINENTNNTVAAGVITA